MCVWLENVKVCDVAVAKKERDELTHLSDFFSPLVMMSSTKATSISVVMVLAHYDDVDVVRAMAQW